jgi:predicted RNA-binding Zn-ribbon protein involved in translation (DUF1610 family)
MRKFKVILAVTMVFCLLGGSFSYPSEAKASDINQASIIQPRAEACPSCGVGFLTQKYVYGPWYYTGVYDATCPNHGAAHVRKHYERTVDTYKDCTNCDFGYYVSTWLQTAYGHPDL